MPIKFVNVNLGFRCIFIDPEGTGVLFYDYVRIKKLLIQHNKKHHLFWLFENVASMPKKFRNQISK